MSRLNFTNPWFKDRYKREAKVWTLEQIHDLWERTIERSATRQSEKSACTREIVKEIPKDSQDRHIVYFKRKDDKNINQYEFSYHRDWKGYGVSQNRVEFSKEKLAGREDKLTFILANDKAFELGQKYHELDKMCSNLHWRVRNTLWEIVEERLRDHFKKTDTIPDEFFLIDIGPKKYYVQTDDQHRYGWMKFHLKGEFSDTSIKI